MPDKMSRRTFIKVAGLTAGAIAGCSALGDSVYANTLPLKTIEVTPEQVILRL